MIFKQQNAKSVTDASIWVKFISENSNRLEIEHILLINPIHRILGQFVNKLQILFYDRAFSR